MTGRERISNVLTGRPVDRLPALPILHSGLAGIFGVPLGRYYTDAATMAAVTIDGWRRFGLDGVQLSLGATGEAEALGAAVDQPSDAAPILRQHLLSDPADLDRLRDRDPGTGGRMPLFFSAVETVSREIGDRAFVLATLRGPLLIASQLRGIEDTLIDMIERPGDTDRLLTFTTEVVTKVATPLLATGANGLLLGEATCSPNFISPDFYRRLVLPHHRRLIARLRRIGWRFVGLHICGRITPIIEDIISAGVDFFDVDYQVSADNVVALVGGRAAMRGNLDPASVFRFGSTDEVVRCTEALCSATRHARWIAGSGCDIPPGTPADNIAAFVSTVGAGGVV